MSDKTLSDDRLQECIQLWGVGLPVPDFEFREAFMMASEIKRIRAEVAIARDNFMLCEMPARELVERLEIADKRIDELETLHRETVEEINAQGDGRFITDADIDKAWKWIQEYWTGPYTTVGRWLLRMLEQFFHIFECSECGGSGALQQFMVDPPVNQGECPACNRNGKSHGWVWRNDD